MNFSMREILVTGADGQLGSDVVDELESRHMLARGTTRLNFSLENPAETRAFIEGFKPAAIVHCAAYTAVDRAESEPEKARAVNVDGTRAVAQACAAVGAKMVYISTDYVFAGEGEEAHEIEDETAPLNVYGQTKLEGEEVVRDALDEHFIVRVSWVFGKAGKGNFVKTILRLAGERGELAIVSDQIGSPTYTRDLAVLIADMLQTEAYGTYQATNEGYVSWADFAREIFRQKGLDVKVTEQKTADYKTPARRPLNSRLSKASLDEGGFSRLPAWQDALARYLEELE
ncbi:dTDP-4-dehydrorhamnose reductase [Selenomonas sp. TAMA-11512]|uniref:dTDP-4-dehydrorhamnose reductase n=1 Tax=Selenomonas sp. TAMA-11512 TaxID=3095337 RepID=UPI0030924486|nr:dTDP-4-dehydrorhamnose reductase [Selenomonas sp. TAMA-11512]